MDEARQSRTIAGQGMECMRSLVQQRFLIVGLRGVGAEVAKNLVVSGPRSVTLCDPAPVTAPDLGANFFLREGDVGLPRDAATLPRLQPLNPGVRLGLLGEGALLSEVAGGAFDAVVVTSGPREFAERVNGACRAARVPFICTMLHGVYGYAFSDFGDEWEVRIPGEGKAEKLFAVERVRLEPPPMQAWSCTTCACPGEGPGNCSVCGCENTVVAQWHWACGVCATRSEGPGATCGACTVAGRIGPSTLPQRTVTVAHVGWRVDLDPVQCDRIEMPRPLVKFRGVGGVPALCNGTARRLAAARLNPGHSPPETTGAPSTMELDVLLEPGEGWGEGWGDFTRGGFLELQEEPMALHHAPLARALQAAESLDRQPLLGEPGHKAAVLAAFSGVEAWRRENSGALPPVRDAAAVEACVKLAAGEGPPLSGPAELIARRVAALAAVELPALCAFFGGVAAQEAVKVTRCGTPLNQWLFWDAAGVLPEGGDPGAPPPAGVAPQPPADFAPAGTRYDGVTAILGRPLQDRVMGARVFLVGAGALGCEFFKNFALMGVGAGPGGQITVTDMDHIEVSNLSRQFLFHDKDVRKPKSATAAAAAKEINPALNVVALEDRVGPETEGAPFTDAFWDGLTLVVTALDNAEARFFVDAKCRWHGKPMLDSGTHGLSFQTMPTVPKVTRAYSDGHTPQEKKRVEDGSESCTLKFFPFLPGHCVLWSLLHFKEIFGDAVSAAAKFLEAPDAWLAGNAMNFPQRRRANAEAAEGVLVVAAAASAAAPYEGCVAAACELFHKHFDTGIRQLLFITPESTFRGSRRKPAPIEFIAGNALHLGFVTHAAALLTAAVGVQVPRGFDVAHAAAAAAARLPPFTPKKGHVKADDSDAKEGGLENDLPEAEAAEARMRALGAALAGRALALAPADFEKDDDTHADFITAAANLRAMNYTIVSEAAPMPRHEVMALTKKIQPAVATSTAAATGAVCADLCQVLGGQDLRKLQRVGASLAGGVTPNPASFPFWTTLIEDPTPLGANSPFTTWDKEELNKGGERDLTLEELEGHFGGRGLQVDAVLYANARLDKTPGVVKTTTVMEAISVAVQRSKKLDEKPLPPLVKGRNWVKLQVWCSNESCEEVAMAPIQYFFPSGEGGGGGSS